jgi:hypothetical protein
MKTLVLVLWVFACAALGQAGSDVSLPSAPGAHEQATITRADWTAIALNAGLRVADSTYTCANLHEGAREVMLPVHSCAGVTAWNVATIPLQIGAVYVLRKHHRGGIARIVAWAFPVADAVAIGFSAESGR